MKKITNKINFQKGLVLINVLIFAVIAVIITIALINWAATMIKHTRQLSAKEQAMQIAEAGIDYYRWHLAHYPTDYKDGTATTTNGPFVHDFKDKDGNVIGQFSLTITPPLIGSTLVRIRSTGTVVDTPGVSRTIQVAMAIPSFARYATIANDFMNFGSGTEVFGPIHSNGGIRFDGLAHNVISSSLSSVDDPDHNDSGAEKFEFGVHTHVNAPPASGITTGYVSAETPPNPVQNRTDVFIAGRQFPVPVVDFLGITTDLAKMKADAISAGKYYPSSGMQGYRIVLRTDDKFDIYRVRNLAAVPDNDCENDQNETGWGTWSIRTPFNNTNTPTVQTGVPIPANGIIFVEDNVWVEGQISTARVTIAAGRFPDNPTTWRNIIVNNNLRYSNTDGTDTIALIAQGNILTGLYDDGGGENLRIDAAVIAQNGRVGRYYYSSDCGSTRLMNEITLFGMIGSNKRYGFAWGSGSTITSGFQERNIVYDGNLLYAPPPSFPLTSNQYTTLSWEEIE